MTNKLEKMIAEKEALELESKELEHKMRTRRTVDWTDENVAEIKRDHTNCGRILNRLEVLGKKIELAQDSVA